MSLSMFMSIVMAVIGVIYTVSTFSLPAARIGNPVEPKIFPAMLSIALLILSIILIIQEIRKRKATVTQEESTKKYKFGSAELSIIFTVLNGLLYALLFNKIGYVFSTIIFLEIQLVIFRGLKKWLNSLIIAVLFASIAFLLFDVALGIYLPTSALGFI